MENASPTDYELICSYLAGEESAFEALYRRHRKRLYGYLNGLLPDRPAEADEVFQLTWIRVTDRLPRYQDQGCFPAWLFRLARNILIDRARRNRREADFLELDSDNAPVPAAPAGSEPWRHLDEQDIGKAVRMAMEELPPKQREVFLMRSTESMPFKEIARIQACSINTVLARMQYALKHLRERLGEIDKGGLIQ